MNLLCNFVACLAWINMAFTEQEKNLAWKKARIVEGYPPEMYRKDACGAWIAWDKYGRRDNDFGWEIDHIYPESLGGDNQPDNLRALHYLNNISKGDDYPSYMAAVKAEGNENIRKERSLIVNEKIREKLSQLYHID